MAPFKPAGWSISGTISPAAGGNGATVTLSGPANAATTADASGNYVFSGLTNGTYTVTPSRNGYTFAPVNQSVTLNGASASGVNFTAQSGSTCSLSRTYSPASSGSGASVTSSCASGATTTADPSGTCT